jgi:muramidase (phage lysozyme)
MPRESYIADGSKALLSPVRRSTGDSGAYNSFHFGRVVNIVMNINDPLYTKYGALEAIEFEPVQDRSIVDESGDVKKSYLIAYKLSPMIKTPVINEIVPLMIAPAYNIQQLKYQFVEVFYYMDPVSLYAAIEHNAAPDENTINRLKSDSSNNKLSSYQNAGNGISRDNSNLISSNDEVKLGNYFKEKGIKPLLPLEGDYKLEGRFGNSIRLGGTPSPNISKNLSWRGSTIGSPSIILRNRPGNLVDYSFEDINKDGSSFYILSDQTIELELASNNFDTYNQQNDNSKVNQQIVQQRKFLQPITQSASSIDNVLHTESVSFPVSQSILVGSSITSSNDISNIPDNEDDLNFVQIGEDIAIPLTQGVILNKFNTKYTFVPSINNSSNSNSLSKAPVIKTSFVNAINSYSGQVSNVPTITKNGKALLDLLSLTEGTIGQGKFNGYDLIVGGNLIPGYDTAIANPPHPNIKIYISEYKIYSSAAGRYQFIINTWNLIMGNGTTMNKFNQDYACWKNILNSANVPSLLITKIDTDFDSFKKVVNMMASQWASLPILNDPKGLYGQSGRFTFETLYTYYKQILQKYQ